MHILSPFDPLIIQRKRTHLFFDYEHRFEAYIPKEKRVFGYFALPVLVGDRIVAAIDLKTDRKAKTLLMQKWSWVGGRAPKGLKARIEDELGIASRRFNWGSREVSVILKRCAASMKACAALRSESWSRLIPAIHVFRLFASSS